MTGTQNARGPIPAQNRCPYCGDYCTPYIRAVTTQKSCDKAACRKKRQQEASKAWREKNPAYFRGRYKSKVKVWLAARPGYLRRYRARLLRMQKHKRVHSDIENGLEHGLLERATNALQGRVQPIDDTLLSPIPLFHKVSQQEIAAAATPHRKRC